MIITVKIDVTKIDKRAIFEGQKGKYVDLTVFVNDQKDQYGNDGMVTQDIGKERRDAGEKGPILGNCKVIKGGNQQRAAPQRQQPQRQPVKGYNPHPPQSSADNFPPGLDDDEIPF